MHSTAAGNLRAVSFLSPTTSRLWRTVGAAGLLWTLVWCFAVLFLWLAQSRLLFMTGESRTFAAPFDSSVFLEEAFSNPDGLRLDAVRLTQEQGSSRYWILFCPPAGASIRLARIQEHLRYLWSLGYNVFGFD